MCFNCFSFLLNQFADHLNFFSSPSPSPPPPPPSSSFCEVPVKVFCLFFDWAIFFKKLICSNYVYVRDTLCCLYVLYLLPLGGFPFVFPYAVFKTNYGKFQYIQKQRKPIYLLPSFNSNQSLSMYTLTHFFIPSSNSMPTMERYFEANSWYHILLCVLVCTKKR